ncbi:hypothetical protein TYRP_016966 [Tyrophagus putrescentiae]|nr:hypothetical protein TYRP_016966 [Tyrophagus putrescentiae]
MSSTANNNSASNPGGPSNTTRSAPNMAPDASSSANCDPAANAYTQITLPGGITIAVQAPNLVFTFGDQPSSSSSGQQGRTATPFILRQLSASVNGNGNGNASNGDGPAVPNSAAASAAPANLSSSATEYRNQPANHQPMATTTTISSSSNGLQSTATPTVVVGVNTNGGGSGSGGGGSDPPSSSLPAVTTTSTSTIPTSIGAPLPPVNVTTATTSSSAFAFVVNTVRGHPCPAHPIDPTFNHLPSNSSIRGGGLNSSSSSPSSPSFLDAGQMQAAYVRAYNRARLECAQEEARTAAARLQALQAMQQKLRQKASEMQNN